MAPPTPGKERNWCNEEKKKKKQGRRSGWEKRKRERQTRQADQGSTLSSDIKNSHKWVMPTDSPNDCKLSVPHLLFLTAHSTLHSLCSNYYSEGNMSNSQSFYVSMYFEAPPCAAAGSARLWLRTFLCVWRRASCSAALFRRWLSNINIHSFCHLTFLLIMF